MWFAVLWAPRPVARARASCPLCLLWLLCLLMLFQSLSPLASFSAPAVPALPDVPAPDALVPLPADRGAYAVLVEAVRICLGDEHHLVIQAALNFVYVRSTEHSSRCPRACCCLAAPSFSGSCVLCVCSQLRPLGQLRTVLSVAAHSPVG